MYSTTELLTLFDFKSYEKKCRNHINSLLNTKPETEFKPRILSYILTKRIHPALAIKLALLDNRFKAICLDPSLCEHWRSYVIKYFEFKDKMTQARDDIKPFYQALKFYCFFESIFAKDTRQTQWQKLALRFGSWNIAALQNAEDGYRLFHEPLYLVPFIARQMIERTKSIAILHLTPGFFLLADVYKAIGDLFSFHAECFQTYYIETSVSHYKTCHDELKKYATEFYRCAFEALIFSQCLLKYGKASEIAYKNVERADKTIFQRRFGFDSITEAKKYLCDKLPSDTRTNTIIGAICHALLFQQDRDPQKPKNEITMETLDKLTRLLPSPHGLD